MIASKPDGQADDMVAAFAAVPRRSAIALAGACGWQLATTPGLTVCGPRSVRSRKPRSRTSIALVLTPMITGIGSEKSPGNCTLASFNAIMAAAYANCV